MSWRDYLPATYGDLRTIWAYVLDQTEQITTMGERTMARVDDMVARMNAATDELARDLDALRAEVAEMDEGVAAKFEPLVARLEAMGADPANPVPEVVTSDGGTDAGAGTTGDIDVVNPTPGASDNPDA